MHENMSEKVRDLERRVRELEEENETTKQELWRAQTRSAELEIRLKEDRKPVAQDDAIAIYRKSPSWEVTEEELEITDEELGRGAWAVVKVAKLKVAAKCLHDDLIFDYHREQFRREMDIAARVSHPNLLRFLGARLEGGMVILTELMPTSLRVLVNRRPQKCLPLEHILSIASDVARALNYLHSIVPDPIIHRDISSANILLQQTLNGGWLAKVSDYGTAKLKSTIRTKNPGCPAYNAPESSNPALQTPKMDIYSFGAVLVEMYTCGFPTPEHREELIRTIDHPKLLNLIRQCLNEEIDQRPTAANVVYLLKAMI